MRIHSIRWRLTFSYAAIACLAALALGTVLLAILRGYYAGKERDYLISNAESFKQLMSSTMAEDVPVSTLKSQLENLAFFSKVRIRVLDAQGRELVDTGTPDRPHIISFFYSAPDQTRGGLQVQSIKLDPASDLAFSGQTDTWLVAGGGQSAPSSVSTANGASSGTALFERPVPGAASGGVVGGTVVSGPGIVSSGSRPVEGNVMVLNAVSALPLSSTFYGFTLGSGADNGVVDLDPVHRSRQQVRSSLFDARHNRLGTIIVSDGPAYGSEIVSSVARGWALAGGIAILLAAAAGWLVSRQIGKPLLALTGVTARMTAGDLATRANVERQDELGALALSFNAMADRIQETVVTLQRFVADAAHELHTPLTALRTNLELAESEQPSVALRRAHEQVIRLEKLTDGLLALSRIEAHTGTEQAVPVDLGVLIRSTSELYASRAEQAGLDYVFSLPDQVPPVLGRADQLECVVSNLMDNAIKFTPAGGEVSLSLKAFDQALELVVRDSGIGIPPDDLPLLFERFRRGHNAVNYPGSGLGLAITKAIVRAYGGSIHAESGTAESGTAEGSSTGTTITIRLPLACPPSADSPS